MKIAIIGGGPIGMEAALAARRRGMDVALYEAGRVGGHLRRFGHVELFTPFHMNSTAAGRARLRDAGMSLPPDDAIVSAADLVERYLVPMARLPELRGSILEGSRVTGIAREGWTKSRGVAGAGAPSRGAWAFLLRVKTPDGSVRLDRADVVLDASGTYAHANATGAGGLPAAGEERLGDRLEQQIPDLLGEARRRYEGRKILLVGDGHSAATALLLLDQLYVAGGPRGRLEVDWVHRDREVDGVYCELEDDPLPARRDLLRRANAIARRAPWLRRHAGATVASYGAAASGRIRAALTLPSREERSVDIDRVLALVGYRPDLELFRELQIHLCYASEAPMKLAAALLAASLADPDKAGDCLGQTSHGADSLKSPEPGFYILGAKSYGRGNQFLLTVGHQQIEEVFRLMDEEGSRQSAASSTGG